MILMGPFLLRIFCDLCWQYADDTFYNMSYDLCVWSLLNFNLIGPYFLKFLVKSNTSGQMSGSLGNFAHLHVFT